MWFSFRSIRLSGASSNTKPTNRQIPHTSILLNNIKPHPLCLIIKEVQACFRFWEKVRRNTPSSPISSAPYWQSGEVREKQQAKLTSTNIAYQKYSRVLKAYLCWQYALRFPFFHYDHHFSHPGIDRTQNKMECLHWQVQFWPQSIRNPQR